MTALVPHNEAQDTLAAIAPELLAGQLAPSSIAMYRRDFACYVEYAQSPAAALQAATLARWRTHLAQQTTHAPNTINRMLSAVKRLMQEAATQGYLEGSVAQAFGEVRGVTAKALKERQRKGNRTRITKEQMRALCMVPTTSTPEGCRDRALLLTLASSGCRISEVTTLRRSQIQSKGNSYVVLVTGKNDTEPREAPLNAEAFRAIEQWLTIRSLAADDIFTGIRPQNGEPTTRRITNVRAWQIVVAYAAKLGLSHIKPHDFRRFVGTQLAQRDIRKAQKALGHKDIRTTADHYVLDELEPGLTDDLF